MFRRGFHGHNRCLSAGIERDVDGGRLTHGKNKVGNLLRAEARCGNLERIATRVNIRENICAGVVGEGVALDTGVRIMQSSGRFWHDRTRGVANNPVKRRRGKLSEGSRG